MATTKAPDPHKLAMLGTDAERDAYIAARRKAAAGVHGDRERLDLAGRPPADPAFDLDPAQGFAVLDAGTVDGVEDVLTAARGVIARHGPGGVDFPNKPHMRTGLLENGDLAPDGPFLRLALRPDVVAAVARYLGVWPVLGTLDVWHSRHVPGEPMSSQLYHCDFADVRQVKLFVFCTDVTRDSGPLTVLDASVSGRIRDALGYRYGDTARIEDDRVRDLMGDSAPAPLCGPAGTVAAVDTSRCLHFGSRVQAGAPPRTVMVAQYLTPYAFAFLRDHRDEAAHRERASATTPRPAQLVLGTN